MKKLGLIINPIAGMGGSVGLKGTDGEAILKKCLQLGAQPQSHQKALASLKNIFPLKENIKILTCPEKMGENIVKHCGFTYQKISQSSGSKTSSTDTQKAAREMKARGADLILFAGGDGTARDIYKAVDVTSVVLGIPAGVKIHSAVFAQNPEKAGELASLFLQNKIRRVIEAEVMDINEEDYRNEILSAKLHGYLLIPYERRYVQNLKSGSPPTEQYSQEAIAQTVLQGLSDEFFYIIGPGTTTRAVMQKLNLENSLLGVDLIYKKQLVGKDLNESELLKQITGEKTKLILTPIGGQGFILGRGNQQISPKVIEQVGKENIIILATLRKIHSLLGQPLLVDTGDDTVNKLFDDYFKIITGFHEYIIYRVTC